MLGSCREMNSWHDFDKKIKKIALGLYYPLLQLVKLMPWVRLMPCLWLWPYVRIMPWGELMAWLRQKNKKDSPLLVLSSPAIGETHAVSSTHAMTLVHAVGNGNGEQRLWKIGRTHAATRQPHGHKKQWFWKNWSKSCHDPSTSWP